jgi:Zn-dependent peptidase ImmA (M78 family)
MAVTNHDQSAEIKSFAAFHNLGHAVDENDLVLQVQFVWINSHAIPLFFLPTSNRQDSLE